MTSAEITHDLYKWLVHLQILPNILKYKASGNFELQIRLQQQLQSGFLIAKLLTNLAAQRNITLNAPLLSSIKNSNTPAARVYNWNILTDSFVKLGIILPKQSQKQITSGNFDSLVLFLLEIQAKTNLKKIQKSSPAPPQQGLDIKKVHSYEEINSSQSVLQFIIVLLSKSIGLSPKQAVATLAESSKYLAHMIVKGVKNSFDEIVAFVHQATQKMDKIMFLVETDAEKNMEFLLQVFKTTLISRESEVAKAGAQLFKALSYESFKYNSKNIVYQILCKESEGFDFLYMGLKRHPYLNFQFFEFIYPLMRGILKDFIDVQLKRTINNDQEYLKTIILIIQPLLENKQAKAEIVSNGLFAQWQKNLDGVSNSKLKGKDLIAVNEQTKLLNLELMYMLWLGYYKQLEPNHAQELLIKITEQLKKNTRNESYTIRIPSLLKLFNILEFLATNKNKLAALLYKKIIFLFVQNHNQNQMRQIVLENLTLIIRKFPTIPLQFLLEPMLKQLTSKQGTSYILNMYDFQFIIQLCKHPKMEQYYAITFLDYFISLYTKSVIYSSLIFRVIEAITARFCQSEQIRQYCLKSTDVCLNNYGMLVMGKTKGNKANYHVNKGQNKQEIIINNQKKSLIIELIKHFISLQHKQMTEEIKQKVAELFIEWYQSRSHYDKGLAAILMQIGDVEDILIQFKQKQMENIKEETNGTPISNQFDSKNSVPETDRNSKNQLLKYEDYYEAEGKQSPQLQGMGYKKKKRQPLTKFQLSQSRSKNIKPDPKVLQDIEKIKQKWKLDHSRAKLEEQQSKKDKLQKINQKQLLQRNISLGYSKLPQISNNQILFDFDSVKKRHLKDSLDLINIEGEQQRQSKSFTNIIQRYQKYIRNLFTIYASKSGPLSEDKQQNILSFTEIMRLLKDKNLIAKIPKIAINEIITTINQKRKKEKNVLGGIYEEDFPTFILFFTDLLMQQDAVSKKDEPFGIKVEKVVLRLLQGEKNVKQLFDPNLQKIKEDLQFNENLEIPQDYRKVKQMQIELDYTIKNQETSIDSAFVDCYQIIDGLVYEAVGVHIISPFTLFKQKYTLAKINKPISKMNSKSVDKKLARSGTEAEQLNISNQIVHKDILADSHNSFTKPLKKLSKNVLKKKSQSQRNMAEQQGKKQDQEERDKKRQIHAKKLKQQILKMREEKQKVQMQKKDQQKVQQQKKKKKQQLRKQYLQQNKRKLIQKKQQDDKKNQQQQKQKKQNLQKRKAEVKSKQAEMLEKQKKLIQQKKEKLVERTKAKQQKQQEKQKLNKSKSQEKLLKEMKVSATDQKLRDLLIKNSIEKGEIKELIDKNRKNLEDLFEIYWNWDSKKMDLKNLAQMLKDLQTTKYIPPKQISDTYKNVAKGQLLSVQTFIQCLVKLSYRSSAIQQQLKQKIKRAEQSQNQGQNNKIDTVQFQFMLKLLKMSEQNYKQTITRIKNEKQQK